MRKKVAALALLAAAPLATMEGLPANGQAPVTTTTTITIQRPRPEHAAAPGWARMMEPQELRPGRSFGQTSDAGILSGYPHIDAGGGGLRIFFVQAGSGPRVEPPAYRLVVFDAAGQRYLPERVEAGGMGVRDTQLSRAIFLLRPEVLPPGKAAYIAAEQVAPRAK